MTGDSEVTGTKYIDDNGQTVEVKPGLGDWWICARNGHRVKSPALPARKSPEECQANLDAYAAKRGWEAAPKSEPTAFTKLTATDALVVSAAVALLKALELEDTELNVRDVTLALGHVQDWLYEMNRAYEGNAEEGSFVFALVSREVGVEP